MPRHGLPRDTFVRIAIHPEYSDLVAPYLPPKEEVWGLITSPSLLTHSGYR